MSTNEMIPLMKNLIENKDFQVNYEISERQRNIILACGMLSHIKNK